MSDAQLKSVCLKFRKGLIKGREGDMMCGVVTYPLAAFLGMMGVAAEIEEVDLKYSNHVFLILSDGRVLDATADQFGGPKVFLGNRQWYHQDQNKNPEANHE